MARFKFVENAVDVKLNGWEAEIYSKPGCAVVRVTLNGRKKHDQPCDSVHGARCWVQSFGHDDNPAQQLANMLHYVGLWADNGTY